MSISLDLLTKKEIIDAYKEYDFLSEIEVSDYADIMERASEFFWTKTPRSYVGINKFKRGYILTTNKYAVKKDTQKISMFPQDSNFLNIGFLPVIKDKDFFDNIQNNHNNPDYILNYEYPCSLASIDKSKKLFDLLKKGKLEKTGRTFNNWEEYYLNGEKYILCDSFRDSTRNDGRIVKYGEKIWFKVEKIKWRTIRKNKMYICTKILTANRFSDEPYYGKFQNTNAYKVLNKLQEEMSQIMPDVNYCVDDNDISNPLRFGFVSKNEYLELKKDFFINISDYAKSQVVTDIYMTGSYSNNKFGWTHGYLPKINYELIKDKCEVVKSSAGYLIVTFGEYPEDKLSEVESKEISAYMSTNWHKSLTGKTYTSVKNSILTDTGQWILTFDSSKLLTSREYEYKGKKYIETDNGEWFRVNKIEWIVNLKTGKAICPTVLFSGINFLVNQDIRGSNLDKYLMKFFSKEIIPSKSRNVDKINDMISNDIALQMLMNKQNLTIEDLELDSESKLVLRR